jgi:hypothetical protein
MNGSETLQRDKRGSRKKRVRREYRERKKRMFGAKSHRGPVRSGVCFHLVLSAQKVEDLWPDLVVFS